MNRLEEYFEACRTSLFGDFEEDEERCYFIFQRGKPLANQIKSSAVFVSSLLELWNEVAKVNKLRNGKNEEDAKKRLTDLALDLEAKAVPILLSPETFLMIIMMKGEDVGEGVKVEKKSDREEAKTSREEVKEKTEKPSGKSKNLPKVALVHFPKRKGFPYALLGDTKPLRMFLKFEDSDEKISAFVSNVNKEFGRGWNLKEEAMELVKSEDGKTLELVEYDTPDKYAASLE